MTRAVLLVVLVGLVSPVFARSGVKKPAIFIEFAQGRTRDPQVGEFEVAVWDDGRIVWRDPAPVYAQKNGVWRLQPGKYYQAVVPRSAIRAALDRLRKAGVYGTDDGLSYPPDASHTAITVRDGKRRVHLTSWHEPDGQDSSSNRPKHAEAVKAWRAIRKEVKALIPSKGKPIARPDCSDWDRP
jgi:hypothetical protein